MMRKLNRFNRILSFLLAVVLFLGVIPLAVFSTDDRGAPDITLNGEKIGSMELRPHEKLEILAEGAGETAQYQWQILHPEKENLWVNIYDATGQSIPVTLALVGNMLNADNVAQLRCRVLADGKQRESAPVTVRLLEEESGVGMVPEVYMAAEPETAQDVEGSVMPLAEGDPTEPTEGTGAETPEYVVVKVEYVKYDYVPDANNKLVLTKIGTAFNPYVATLHYGSPLNDTTVNFPTMIGYDTYLEQENGTEVKLDELSLALDSVTKDITYTVNYKPADVKYTVRYYKQNIYDDQYVEDTQNAEKDLMGETGTAPDPDKVNRTFEGFSSLFYQPDFIAADGSTVFEVYYERNYYLMEFDCNGGYGADTVYVRYETHISIPDPVKAGWVFDGWDLVRTENSGNQDTLGDGVKNDLPAKMPAYNSAYKAIWKQADTTYNVSYWIVEDDGSRTYLGGHIENGLSGNYVSGNHDLGLDSDTGYVCDMTAHTHTDGCYTCGLGEHKHELSCFVSWGVNYPGSDGESAIAAVNDGKNNPESGYIYLINNGVNELYWPKLYLEDDNGNGAYYEVNGISGGPAGSFDAIIDGPALGTGAGNNNHTAIKYKAKTTCGEEQHAHDNACRRCEEHAHTQNCKVDATYLNPVDSITVTKKDGTPVTYTTDTNVLLKGDGSSVVNVYYQYKQYTLKFYYAATTGGTASDKDQNADTYDTIRVAGGNTWSFGNDSYPGPDDGSQLANVGNWGLVDELPTLNEEGQKRSYTKGSLTHTNGTTYHYISFTARYGDDISKLWPCSVFNSVTRVEANTHVYWSGTEAFVSAWNGEHRVRYSQDNENETIKGNYEKLDENLLFDLRKFADSDEVSYLCFWENGDSVYWSVPELYRYNIYLETYSGQDLTNELTIERHGKTYYRESVYDTCDNSTPGEQTQAALQGFQIVTFASDNNNYPGYQYANVQDPKIPGYFEYRTMATTEFDTTLYREGYDVNFYYDRIQYKLSFWNHDRHLTDGSGATVPYDEPLEKRFEGITVNGEVFEGANDLIAKPEKYPSSLEPNAYKFEGWYTTPEFQADTKVDWTDMRMPDADLRVYAYWKPIVRNVYFYYLYDQIAAKDPWTEPTDEDGNRVVDKNGNPVTISYPIKAPHGTLLGTTYNYTPKRDGYTFVGWFYMDENNKKRFAPDTMEVAQDLHLFAEWQSGIDTSYEVTYVLKEAYGGYLAGHPIADPTAGHITAGKTKSFSAKGMTELKPEFRTGFFPEFNSHSILMDSDQSKNTFVFRYMHDDKVLYKVRYVNSVTGVVMDESDVMETTDAIITEKFKPFTGYLPQDYYIRKTLAYDGQATEPDPANIITFYYTPDTKHGLYSIEYYLENMDSAYDPDHDDATEQAYLSQHFTKYVSIVNSADLDVVIEADIRTFEGYTFRRELNTVITYNTDGSEKHVAVGGDPKGTIEHTGLTIRLYYLRDTYKYKVTYIDADTDTELTPEDADLQAMLKEQEGHFDEEFTHTAQATFKTADEKTYEYYIADADDEERTKSRTVRASNNLEDNTMKFYYTQKKVTVEYHAECKIEGATEFGYVSPNSEWGTRAGSTATALNGFRFVGWYKDKDCTQPVDDGWADGAKLTPQDLIEDEDWTNHYYALFEPVQEDLKIIKTAATGTDLGDDTFLFRVTGTDVLGNQVNLMVSIQGVGSVTIKNLYCGTYTVEELTDWSWTYQCTDDVTKTVKLTTQDKDGEGILLDPQITTNEVIFTNAAQSVDWLHGESAANENKFQ